MGKTNYHSKTSNRHEASKKKQKSISHSKKAAFKTSDCAAFLQAIIRCSDAVHCGLIDARKRPLNEGK